MHIIIFGATGSLGRHVVENALTHGHTVTAFTRSGTFSHSNDPQLSVVKGDVQSASDVAKAIEGHTAVICALGAGRKGGIRTQGTQNILAGMKEHDVKRLVCLSSLGVGDSRPALNFFWKYIMFGLLLRPAFADHHTQEAAIRASDTDWTIVRPAAFTDGDLTQNYHHGFSAKTKRDLQLKISRKDVADFMVTQIGTDKYSHQTPSLSY